MRWAVFLDRDGTINEEVGYLRRPADLRLLPGVAFAIRLLNEQSIPVIVVTNQAGVGRGYYAERAVRDVHEELNRQLGEHGARVDALYYCPHHPAEGCACRKPNLGLLLRAASELSIDLPESFVVGDKRTDLEAGERASCTTVLVLTGYGAQAQQECLKDAEAQPGHVAANLAAAVAWIVAQKRPACRGPDD